MHIAHTIHCDPPSSPIQLTLDLLPSAVALVRATANIGVRCPNGTMHLMPVRETIPITHESPPDFIDAAERMIRGIARGVEDVCDIVIDQALQHWYDPCLLPDPLRASEVGVED